MKSEDVIKLMIQSYRRYRSGEITEYQAVRENTLLSNILKANELCETERRLQAIEKTIGIDYNTENGYGQE